VAGSPQIKIGWRTPARRQFSETTACCRQVAKAISAKLAASSGPFIATCRWSFAYRIGSLLE
jgi:hypothetical protein